MGIGYAAAAKKGEVAASKAFAKFPKLLRVKMLIVLRYKIYNIHIGISSI